MEPGKVADLQILDKTPLTDIHNTTSIRYAMKNAQLHQADNVTEVWPRPMPRRRSIYGTPLRRTLAAQPRTCATTDSASFSVFKGVQSTTALLVFVCAAGTPALAALSTVGVPPFSSVLLTGGKHVPLPLRRRRSFPD